MRIKTMHGEELSLGDDLKTGDEIKQAIFTKYGYPPDNQYLHKSGEEYVVGQFRDGADAEKTSPLSEEFLGYGCPGTVAESLRGICGKEEMYEKLLPGLKTKEDVEDKGVAVLDMSGFRDFADFLEKDNFGEKSFIRMIGDRDLGSVIGNEEKYCEEVLEDLIKRDVRDSKAFV